MEDEGRLCERGAGGGVDLVECESALSVICGGGV
jgi:hypothetical protein